MKGLCWCSLSSIDLLDVDCPLGSNDAYPVSPAGPCTPHNGGSREGDTGARTHGSVVPNGESAKVAVEK